ncbi:hypothetical protein [Roseobacter litoralis]|uniref:hypothetical protein n=1 Tax=Roseobacter litoralis TaxID=42443 RepID=UPI00248FA59B|nr:hypothetical protein [Roseobacter litoralis]
MGIQRCRDQVYTSAEQQARHLHFNLTPPPGPEGAVIETGRGADHGRIAVYYDHVDKPPEITISRSTWPVQTVLADGVAVAIVAGANEPELHKEDVVLIARYTAPR